MTRIAVVSGACGGIGRAIVQMLKSEGITCILVGTDINKLLRLYPQKEAEPKLLYQINFENSSDIHNVCTNIIKQFGCPDILINCAGIGGFQRLSDLTVETLEKVIAINLTGTILFTKEFLHPMILERNGQIINMESIASTKGFAYGAAYVASKFGLAGFSEVLWNELKIYGIKVCSIRPGLVNTSFCDCLLKDSNSAYDISESLSPNDISHAVKMVINQSETSNISEIVIRPIKSSAQNLFFNILNEAFDSDKKG